MKKETDTTKLSPPATEPAAEPPSGTPEEADGRMEIEEIKQAILALPDAQIEPLFKWLQEYYDGPVWSRQLQADFAEFGAEEMKAMLQEGMEQRGKEKHRAVLRLLNNLEFRSDAHREECLKDLGIIVDESLP
jgi:DNA-directed RNA polymerase specialized sigma subunit